MAEGEFPDELNYATSTAANIAIVRAMADIRFVARMEKLMPLVARKLIEAGVDFSKAKIEDAPPPSRRHEGKGEEK